MSGTDRVVSSFTKVIMSLVIVCIIGGFSVIILQEKASDIFQDILESNKVKVVRGIVDSPSVIIPIKDSGKIIRLIFSELNTTTVYRYGWTFYVFNEDMTVAYRYIPPIRGWRIFW